LQHRIHVFHEIEDHEIILAQEEIRSEIGWKWNGCCEATKTGPITLKNCTMAYYNQAQIRGTR